nr:hypothetical protein [Streptomyces samsunensis]
MSARPVVSGSMSPRARASARRRSGAANALSLGRHRTAADFRRSAYRASAAYGQSKLANLLFTLELQRRLTRAGSAVRALAAHPGAARTGLNRHLGPVMSLVATAAGRLMMQSEAAGCLPTLFAATRDLAGASYVGPGGRGERRGRPTLVGRGAAARDEVLAAGLWELSERLTDTAFPLG